MGDEARRERLAAALRANLRRRKTGATGDGYPLAPTADETVAPPEPPVDRPGR